MVCASASDQARNGTHKHANHAKPQQACAAHACVEEDTVCSGLGFAFVLGRDCVLVSLLGVSLWATVVRWLLIEKHAVLRFC